MPFPIIQTERLVLRPVQPTDKDFILKGLSDPRVTEYYAVHYSTLEDVEEQMQFYKKLVQEETGVWWVLCSKGNNSPIGACGLSSLEREHRKAEIGFWLLPEYWGKGYIPEAARAVTDYAFDELDLNRIEAIVEGGNTASEKVLQKLGFTCEGRLRERELKAGQFIDLVYYGLLKKDILQGTVKAGQTMSGECA